VKTEVIWQQLIEGGTEHLILRQGARIAAEGLAVGVLQGAVYRIQYQIVCNAAWHVARVKIRDLLNRKEIAFYPGPEGRWIHDPGPAFDALQRCTDVDIMVTPFTNTLAIRRLNLAPGESREIAVVYVRVPGLDLSSLEQRYTCLSQDPQGGVYKYENLETGFTSDLKVDADGLVVDYPGIFKLAWKKSE